MYLIDWTSCVIKMGFLEFSIHPVTGLVYLACSTIKSRKTWGTYFLLFDKPSTEDYVAIYDPAASTPDRQVRRLKLQGLDDTRGINAHGFDLVPSRKNPDTEAFVYLVNHRPRLDGRSAELGADSAIELFKTTIGSDTLVHIKTFEDENVIITPNDLSGSADDDSFFFMNDHGTRADKVLSFLSWVLRSSFIDSSE